MNNKSIKRQAFRTSAAIRGMSADGGSGAHLWHLAPYIHCQNKALPPVGEYETWLAANSIKKHGCSAISAAKLRRAVIMRRNGQTLKDIGRVIGMTGPSVERWITKLPPELAA